MFLIAATTFGQSDRRTSNRDRSAQKNTTTKTETSREQTTTRQKSSTTDRQSRVESGQRTSDRQSTGTTNTTRTESRETRNDQQQNNQDRSATRDNDANTNQRNRDYQEHRDDRHHANTAREREYNRDRPTVNHAAHTVPHHDYSSPRVYRDRHEINHYYHHNPESRSYRSIHYVYRSPVNINVVWTPVMYRRYREIYPMIKVWYYPVGYRIGTISAYDALFYTGEVMNVYGKVTEVYYSHGTDEYFLYFGPYYPYQDFTVVLPGWVARSFSPQPMRFFENQYLLATGLITSFEDVPEIVVKDQIQVQLY